MTHSLAVMVSKTDNQPYAISSTTIKATDAFTLKATVGVGTVSVVVTVMSILCSDIGALIYIFTNYTITGPTNPTLTIVITIYVNTVSEFGTQVSPIITFVNIFACQTITIETRFTFTFTTARCICANRMY